MTSSARLNASWATRPVRIAGTLAAVGLLAGALAACRSDTPPAGSGNPGPGNDPGTAVLGSGPPNTSPSPGAVTSSPAAPAQPVPHSTIASKVGFVWDSQPASSYTAASAYQYNSAGGAISVAHNGTGNYKVTFAALGTQGGIAHAQAYGSAANFCSVTSWGPSGSDEVVSVACYDQNGTAADAYFTASFAVGSMGSARFSYLWAEQATATAKYQPSAGYRYDAVSSSGITVQRRDVGRYDVYLPAAGPQLHDPWTFQVTAYHNPYLCKLASFTASTRKAQVACRDAGGFFRDSRFALSFASSGSFLGRTDRHFGDVSETSDGVENPSTGVYAVRVAGLGGDKGQAVAVARGTASTYCHVKSWGSSGADLRVNVVCFNPGGAAASSGFEVAATL